MGLFSSVGQAYRFLCAVYGGMAAWVLYTLLHVAALILGDKQLVHTLADVLFLPGVFMIALVVCLLGVGRPEHFTFPGMLCGYGIVQCALGTWVRRGFKKLRVVLRRLFGKAAARLLR